MQVDVDDVVGIVVWFVFVVGMQGWVFVFVLYGNFVVFVQVCLQYFYQWVGVGIGVDGVVYVFYYVCFEIEVGGGLQYDGVLCWWDVVYCLYDLFDVVGQVLEVQFV